MNLLKNGEVSGAQLLKFEGDPGIPRLNSVWGCGLHF